MSVREKIEKLLKEKKSLPDCVRKRQIETEIRNLQSEHSKSTGNIPQEPSIIVKHAGKPIGMLEYNLQENSWMFNSNDGSKTEVGFTYPEVRSWASMNGFRLKVEAF